LSINLTGYKSEKLSSFYFCSIFLVDGTAPVIYNFPQSYTNSDKSTHPENLGEIPPGLKKLQTFENADKSSKHQENAQLQMARHLLGHLLRHTTRILKFWHLGIHKPHYSTLLSQNPSALSQ
jgi:hypothetical protein